MPTFAPEHDSTGASLRADIAVLGSGPGGCMTACLLAEAGRDVLLVEEGPHLPLDSCNAFTREEMVQKYRNGGLTVAVGRTKVAYVEGCCVGGGSEINSGLHHRTPPEVLQEWRQEFQVEALTEDDLTPHFAACEKDLSVSMMPGAAPIASLLLHEGAGRLGWKSLEVPRWFAYAPTAREPDAGVKQSMTQTLAPRFLRAGGRLLASTRVLRMRRRADGWEIDAEQGPPDQRRRCVLRAGKVFVACGAIQTPALLQRSGLGKLPGRRLHMHPTVKAVARFPQEVNFPGLGVPVHQVKEFSPRISLGCSISSPPHLALAMLDHPDFAAGAMSTWRRHAIYYAMIRGGRGRIRSLPLFRDPLVQYKLAQEDLADLALALKHLCRCLFAAGAEVLFPSVVGLAPLTGIDDLDRLPAFLPPARTNLMTIHLFSSCPMGENQKECVADSFGRVHGEQKLWLADASLLPGPPGVNPQGTILALARRNACQFLEDN